MQTSVIDQLAKGPAALPSDNLLVLARSFESAGELLEAETLYRELITRDGGLEPRVRYAHLLLQLDEPRAALCCVEHGLAEAARDVTGLLRLDYSQWRWLALAFFLWRDLRTLEGSRRTARR